MTTSRLKEEQRSSYSLTEDVAGRKVLFVNYYMIGNPGKGNSWVLVDGALPGSAKVIQKEAEQLFGKGNPPKAIILTHGHFDHVGALPDLLKVWPDVTVFAHPLEMPYLTGRSSYPPPDPTVGGGAMSYMSWAFPIKAYDFGDRVERLHESGNLPFLEGWKYIHTPGHSPGHISLFRESDGLLIAGDAFTTTNQNALSAVLVQKKEVHGPPAYFTIDWSESQNSVEKIKALKPKIAGTGHGLPIFGDDLQNALDRLMDKFDRKEIPSGGRYTAEPAITDEQGIKKMPPAVSYNVARYAAGIMGGIAIAIGVFTIGKKIIQKKK